jgi:hypothetical protein
MLQSPKSDSPPGDQFLLSGWVTDRLVDQKKGVRRHPSSAACRHQRICESFEPHLFAAINVARREMSIGSRWRELSAWSLGDLMPSFSKVSEFENWVTKKNKKFFAQV